MSSTGMPRKNSITTAVGMRIHALRELRSSDRTMPRMRRQHRGDRAARSVPTTPSKR